MEQLIVRTFPIEEEKIENIDKLISSNALILKSFEYDDKSVTYNIFSYLKARDIEKTDFSLLADRNLLTRWIGLCRGKSVIHNNDRLAAGVLAFAQLSEIQIEPNIALYEAAMTNGSEMANQELDIFRRADNLDPKYWASVALEESDKLPDDILNNFNKDRSIGIDFEMPLRRWRRVYVLVLKISEIELQGGGVQQCMSQLFAWMHKDYLMTGTAVILAVHYFAPNNSRKGLLKNLRSQDRELAIKGIKNATWDLFFLEEWFSKIKTQDQENKRWLFCTLDKKLKIFAESLVYFKENENPLESILIKLFGSKIGNNLAHELHMYQLSSNSSERVLNQEHNQPSIASLIEKGEQIIRE